MNNRFTEFNVNDYNSHDYAKAHSPGEHFSVKAEPDIQYEEQIDYLFINSDDRDTSVYPNPNAYVTRFPKEFRNISSIELINAIIPDKNLITQEPYLLLRIDEIDDVMTSNNKHIADSFAFLALANATTAGGFITIDKRIHENTPKVFTTPKASLDKMTISLTDHKGTPWNFGSDTLVPTKSLQHTLVFRIITLRKRRDGLSFRAAF